MSTTADDVWALLRGVLEAQRPTNNMPRYADVRAMGAVAARVVPREVARYAYRQGLYVLAQSGESAVILNDARFQPRVW